MTHPISASITPAVKAVLDYAREIRAYERAQAARHYTNLGLDSACDCDDCRGVEKYPANHYAVARRILNNA